MRLWWVSMSLFMELEGELGVLIFSKELLQLLNETLVGLHVAVHGVGGRAGGVDLLLLLLQWDSALVDEVGEK